jgi:hypothetical protein
MTDPFAELNRVHADLDTPWRTPPRRTIIRRESALVGFGRRLRPWLPRIALAITVILLLSVIAPAAIATAAWWWGI